MDYTDASLVKAQLGYSEDFSSSTVPTLSDVNNWIEEASAEIDARTGQSFAAENFADLVIDYEGNDDIIRLPFEIVSISALSYSSEAAGETPDWSLKTEDVDYFVYGDSSEIEVNTRKFKPLSGRKRFKISGMKGKVSTPLTVQRLATLMTASRAVETIVQNQAYSNSGGDVQVGTIKVGNPSAFSISGQSSAKAEIDSLFSKVVGEMRSYRITRAYDL